MPYTRTVYVALTLKAGLLCSPSLGVQSPNLPWEARSNRKTRSCPSCSPPCSRTPGGRRQVARGSPGEDLQLFPPFLGTVTALHKQGELPKIRTSMKRRRVLTKISCKSQLQPALIPHHCPGAEQLPKTRTARAGERRGRSHSSPSNPELNLPIFSTKIHISYLEPNFLKDLGNLKNQIYFVKDYIERWSQIRRILAKMPFIAVYLYMAYR